MTLLHEIERFLRAHPDHHPTRLGRDAVGDPRFVFDLRAGRDPRPETRQRVLIWLAAQQEAA